MTVSSGDDDGKKADPAMSAAGGFNFGGGAGGRQGSGKRTLSKVKSHFYIGTEVRDQYYILKIMVLHYNFLPEGHF